MLRRACILSSALLTLACSGSTGGAADASVDHDATGIGSRAVEPPIALTVEFHMDPLAQVPIDRRRDMFRERRDNAIWLLDMMESRGVPISFLAGGEFYEFCVEDEERDVCLPLLRRLYESGGSIGTHTHQGVQRGPHDWEQLDTPDVTDELSRQSWADAVRMANQAISAALDITDPAAISAVNNIHGSHLPKEGRDYDALMREYGFAVLESGPEEDFYGLFGHHIWNVYRPSPDNWMTEDTATPYVLVPSGPVVGLSQIHKGVLQDMTMPHVKTMFLQLYANWRYRMRTDTPTQMWTFGVAMHGHDISEGSEVRDAIVEFADWFNMHFVDQRTSSGALIARWRGRMALATEFETWEADNPGAPAFAYPSVERMPDLYPYLLPVADGLQEAHFESFLSDVEGASGFRFQREGTAVVLIWSEREGEQLVDLSAQFDSELVRVVSGVDGSELMESVGEVSVGGAPLIVSAAE